jgi:hypothetical protein
VNDLPAASSGIVTSSGTFELPASFDVNFVIPLSSGACVVGDDEVIFSITVGIVVAVPLFAFSLVRSTNSPSGFSPSSTSKFGFPLAVVDDSPRISSAVVLANKVDCDVAILIGNVSEGFVVVFSPLLPAGPVHLPIISPISWSSVELMATKVVAATIVVVFDGIKGCSVVLEVVVPMLLLPIVCLGTNLVGIDDIVVVREFVDFCIVCLEDDDGVGVDEGIKIVRFGRAEMEEEEDGDGDGVEDTLGKVAKDEEECVGDGVLVDDLLEEGTNGLDDPVVRGEFVAFLMDGNGD